MEITLNLPESVYRNVSTVAKKSKREVADLIVDVVEEKYSSTKKKKMSDRTLTNYSDAEVLELANLQIPKEQSAKHSELLYKNQAGTLSSEEKQELDFFQQIYGVALARKTDGIYEAIQRKLIKTPADLSDE